MSTETRDLLLFAVALFAVAGSAYYYVRGALDRDRLLFRSSAVAFLLFAGLALVLLLRVLS